tara:strand:+ start:54 stop:875 length:822 start_codon:yes stop_codon:yes gene_type:complete
MKIKKTDTLASTGVGAFVIFIAIIIVSSVTMATITITIQKISESTEKNVNDVENEFTGTIVIDGAWLGSQDDCDKDEPGSTGLDTSQDNCIVLIYTLAAGSNVIFEYDVNWVINCNSNNDFTSITGTFDGYGADGAVNGDIDIDDDGDGIKDVRQGCCHYYPTFRDHGESQNIDGTDKLMDADGDGLIDDDDDRIIPGINYMIKLKITTDRNDDRSFEQGTTGNWPPPVDVRDCSPTEVDKEYLTLSIVVNKGGTTYDTIELVENWVEGERVI